MKFAITAELPLGTYRAGGPDGQPEPLPSVARLHAALLCAAGFGPRAHWTGDDVALSEADEAALRWLEENPPDEVTIPALQVNGSQVTAYRNDGTTGRRNKVPIINKLAKQAGGATAVDGRFVWAWTHEPPPEVREALAALCPDVAYLGTSESPVRLRAGLQAVTPTHVLDRQAGPFTSRPRGADVRAVAVPGPGRTSELVADHERRRRGAPTFRQDRPGTDEKSLSPAPPRTAVDTLWYLPPARISVAAPWDRVILLPFDRYIPEPYRVAWAVAAHRALIRLIGEGAPPLITGAYPGEGTRPPNRLALHLLDPTMPYSGRRGETVVAGTSTLALLVPGGADPTDLQVLVEAVHDLQSVRGPGGLLARVVAAPQVVSGDQFWADPPPGYLRLWQTVPAAVPDTRGERGVDWSFIDAALLSLGFVFKNRFAIEPGGASIVHRGLASAVSDAGAAVVHARALRTPHVDRYVHRANTHAVVRPYRALLSLGDLTGPGTVLAIGQSRHLGGGLLVPFDVPESTPASQLRLPDEERQDPR